MISWYNIYVPNFYNFNQDRYLVHVLMNLMYLRTSTHSLINIINGLTGATYLLNKQLSSVLCKIPLVHQHILHSQNESGCRLLPAQNYIFDSGKHPRSAIS